MPKSTESVELDPRGTAALVSTLLTSLRRSDGVAGGSLVGVPTKIGISIEPRSDGTTSVTVEVTGRPPASGTLDGASRSSSGGTVAGLEWNRPGHGVVALIAMQRLSQTHPAIVTAIQALIDQDPRGRTGDPSSPPEPSKDYLDRLVRVAADQGLVGGYRLADVIAEQLQWADLVPAHSGANGRRKNGAHPPSSARRDRGRGRAHA